ncbi:MAG: chemotaxis protein CheA [Motiliproteus sp.]|nr:chemotaxis protein CheA [Motiliproteus sp.]MCW9053056.1 chemotaxis protein CheA [Motiliproteus sp.]
MSIDLSQFQQVFFEESFEGVETMESYLLELDSEDTEALHAIFRAAHSIKGGAGMFDFTTIVDFTHLVETLLDELRSDKRAVTPDLVTLLLQSSDCIKELLHLAQEEDNSTPEQVIATKQQLQALLSGKELSGKELPGEEPSGEALSGNDTSSESLAALEQNSEASTESQDNTPEGWLVTFAPHPEMLQTGNEPLHMLAALQDLGPTDITCNAELLPDWTEINGELCYLSWQIRLQSDVDRDEVEDIFSWVEDECDLTLEPLTEQSQTAPIEAEAGTEQHQSLPELEPEQQPAIQPALPSTPAQPDKSAPTEERRRSDRREKPDRRGTMDRRSGGEATSIRVGTDKIDTLINRVGELVITQSMLAQIGRLESLEGPETLQRLQQGLAQLERSTREIQEDVMQIRMLPISFVFNRFPRLVRDLQGKLGKKLELVISGEGTELDKTLMEKISDPLVHLVRNSIDHGIEMPEQRLEAGKNESGRVELVAYHQGGNIIIEINDDGKGLDADKILEKAREKGLVGEDEEPKLQEIYELIMQPGFSTADEVSDLSGRGVGMDVVRRNINELGGNIEIGSEPGKGSRFKITLPLTLAILDGQQVSLDDQVYIIPLVSIIESIQTPEEPVNAIAGKDPLYCFRGNYIPLISLRKVMGQPEATEQEQLIMIVEANGQQYGLIVDDLLGQQQFVIKSLEENYRKVEGVAGATILADGRVGLILDVVGILRLYRRINQRRARRGDNVIRLNAG